MNNKEKQRASSLELRVMRLENMLWDFAHAINCHADGRYSCSQCGVFDVLGTGYVCTMKDCCQGLNQNDDLEGEQDEI